jgi:hypothetical protein
LWEKTKRCEKYTAVKFLLIVHKYNLYLSVRDRDFSPSSPGVVRYARDKLVAITAVPIRVYGCIWFPPKFCILEFNMVVNYQVTVSGHLKSWPEMIALQKKVQRRTPDFD